MLNDKCGMRVRIRRSLLFYEISLCVSVCVCNNSIIIYLLPKREEHLRFCFLFSSYQLEPPSQNGTTHAIRQFT
ncbi:Uncharacterized protein APZ42_020364 [Daphnia magna]|uniref:Uncharacterized protein n=1 Tax=Daphnia magna TaxID=35525 RepID=A0A0P5TT62_9CRUS|nr:Uncharacterized protein APZ42_020364 [Daphnia magna]